MNPPSHRRLHCAAKPTGSSSVGPKHKRLLNAYRHMLPTLLEPAALCIGVRGIPNVEPPANRDAAIPPE